jgi:sugar phosphate isomerase/epimerase
MLAAGAAALASQATGAADGGAKVKFGLDLFSLRSQGWTPFQYLDFAAKWGIRVVHFSEVRFLGSLEEPNLKAVRAHAEELGIEVEIGMLSICPTSTIFDKSKGMAEEQLTRMAAAARIVGSRIVRCVLGTSADRTSATPLEANIENTVQVLHNVRSRIMDAGLKVAIENHAGDMQAREVKMLIEEAGKDFVGSCLDSGNPLWTIEDPHLTLETLAPYVLTSHVFVEHAAGHRGGVDAHGRRQYRHRGLHSRVRCEVPRPAAVAGDHCHRSALLQLSRSQILGRVPQGSGVGIRARPRAGR